MTSYEVRDIEYFPAQIFRDRIGVVSSFDNSASLGTGTNQAFIAGNSGKNIRVVSMILTSNGTDSSFQFLNASAGAIMFQGRVGATAIVFEFNPNGWFETSTGNGIFATIATNTILISVRYIIYTP